MGRRKTKIKGATDLLTGDLLSDFMVLDPVEFVEQTLTVDGKPFLLNRCGREYLHEIYRYICLEAVGPKGKAVVVKKGRQVEMTTTASAISLYMACSGAYDHIRGLHTFPQVEQARRYSNITFKARVEESTGKCLEKLLEGEGSVTQKPFKSGNFILIEGAGEAGDRLRGLPLDYVLFDEIQDLPKLARENTQEALSHSKFGPPGFGLELDFGTPKDSNSDFHDLWLNSDQRYYHLKCIHCGHYFPLFYEYDNAKNVTDTNFVEDRMVECRDKDGKGCRQRIDKGLAIKKGKWIPLGNINAPRRGYHIDQLLVPDITRQAIDQKLAEKTARGFDNEVMGKFYSGRDTGPSFGEVLECTTTDPDSRNWRFSSLVQDRMTWMGIDWGARVSGEDDEGSGGYTCCVIMSRLPHNKFRIEFAHRMEQADVAAQLEQLNKWIRQYNCKVVCADHGFGGPQNQELLKSFPDVVKKVFSTAGCKVPYKSDPKNSMITIDKHLVFEEVYDLLLSQRAFCLPYAEPVRVEWLMQHISNIEIVTKAYMAGSTRKVYQKQSPTRPIDGSCALVYAYVAYKFQQSSGFTNLQGPTFAGSRNMPMPGGATLKPIAKTAQRGRR